MYNKKHETKPLDSKRINNKITASLLLTVLIVTIITVGITVAYLIDSSDTIKNTFKQSKVTCQVTEDFDGTIKRNVNVSNTGDTEAYIRVKLVPYRANGSGQHIGGVAEVPAFTPGANWVKYGDYYYYTLPVAPGESPATDLIGDAGISLNYYFTDADGGSLCIDVIAEAIQSSPAEAAGQAWGVSIAPGAVSAY
ncbi:MAG: hypothetical protein ACOX1L_00560 [Erysipelotrichaceae bacterium]|jgi:hypothetical protein|nr:hypothetical protein [Erysipelotrichaceae bacterium]